MSGTSADWGRYLSGIMEGSTDSIVITDRDGTVLAWNPGAEQLYGYSAEEALGSSILRVVPEKKHDRVRSRIAAAWERAETEPSEGVRIRKDGERIYVSLALFPVHGDDGEILALCGIGRDISKQKRVQEELRVRETQLRSAQALAGMGSWEWDVESDEVAWSDEMFRLAGREPQEEPLDPAAVVASVHPDDRDRFRDTIGRLREDHEPFEIEYRVVRPDGVTRTVLARGEVYLNDQGEATRVTGTAGDVTDQKMTEASLIRAREDAEAASAAKGDFLANMSHEIRTPLNGVIGMVELLRDTPLDPQQREFLHIARQSADALLNLIEGVLDFSKIEAGGLQLESVPFDAAEVIASTAKTFALRAHAKGLELLVDMDLEMGSRRLVGDPHRFRQILVNLVGNAIKFTEEGEVVIRARTEDADGQTLLRVSVSDTGIGIPEARRESIFEEFSQEDSSTSRRYGGTGLGLTITQRLVEMMNGRIWFDSEPGFGSTFHFTARFGPVDAPVVRASALVAQDEERRILVVDDNATNRRILQETLEGWGFAVAAVADGETALDLFQASDLDGEPFHLAIIDRKMPALDGFDLAAKLGELAVAAPPILMMLSSADSLKDRVRATSLEIQRYLLKPIQQSELYGALVDLLYPARAASAGARTEGSDPWKDTPSLPPLKVLLAEDNKVNERVERELLERRGHEVDVARDGAEAVSRFTSTRYDLVLMDVQMPGMDGLEATEAIRRREETTGRVRTPIIAVTARAMAGDRQQCMEAGMDGYLSKPLRQADLDAELRRVVDAETVERARATRPEGDGAGTRADESEPSSEAPPDLDLSELEVFDRSTLLTLVAGDRELLSEITDLFLASLPDHLEELADARENGNLTRLEATAHALAGSAETVRAERAAAAARELEEMLRRKQGHRLEGAYDLVVRTAREVEDHLRSLTEEE